MSWFLSAANGFLLCLLSVTCAVAQFNGTSGIYALNHMTFGLMSVPAPTIVSGGSGYAIGDIVTLDCPNSVYFPTQAYPTVAVTAVSSGAITKVSLVAPGFATQLPSTGLSGGANGICSMAQVSTSGSGLGASISATFGFIAASTSGSTTPQPSWITPQSFGATCTGTSNDTVALVAWWAALAAGSTGYLPGGSTCTTTQQLNSANGFTLYGAGASVSQLLYNGPTTTGNIFTIGPPSGSATAATRLEGIDFETTTTMSSGYTLLIQNSSSQLNYYNDLWVDVRQYTTTFNGAGFNSARTFNLSNFFFRSSAHDAMDVWATADVGSGAGESISTGLLISSGIGLHIGGHIGGLYTSLVTFGGNDQNVLIDEALGGATNLQIQFGNFTTFDIARAGKSLPGVELSTSGSAPQQVVMFNSDWFSIGASGGNACELQIDSGYLGYVYVGGTTFVNGTFGTCTASPTAFENIAGNYYQHNLITAIHDTGSNPNIIFGPNVYGPGVATGSTTLANGAIGPVGGIGTGPSIWSAPVLQANGTATVQAGIEILGNGGPTDANNWDAFFITSDGSLEFRSLNDTFASSNVWLRSHRFGFVPTGAQFNEPVALQTYTISALPVCSSGGFTTSNTNVPVGSTAYISNGVVTPTFGAAVSATGAYGHHVTCSDSNGSFGWIYE